MFVVGVLSTSLYSIVLPSLSSVNVYATSHSRVFKYKLSDNKKDTSLENKKYLSKEEIKIYLDNYKYKAIDRLNYDESVKYKEAIKKVIIEKNVHYIDIDIILSLVDNQVAKDNNMMVSEDRIFNWQGIETAHMGAAIDVFISAMTSNIVGGLAALSKNAGKHAARSIVRDAISKFFSNKFINFFAIDFLLNLASPGQWMAQYWDAHDSVPNNGRINFW